MPRVDLFDLNGLVVHARQCVVIVQSTQFQRKQAMRLHQSDDALDILDFIHR